MTFEEWKEKHSDLIENVAITFFNYERGVDTKTCYDELEYLLQRAFKAGKDINVSTKWHNLRKNPKDLPETLHPVYAKLDSGKYAFAYCDNKIWHRNDGRILYHGNGKSEVIAWCEIPRFEEE